MADESCPVPTPQERTFMDIKAAAEKTMFDAIYSAIENAASEIADKVRAAGLDIPPPERDYFTFAAQQALFVRLCGGDPESFEGGDPEIGQHIVQNGQNIIDHYWRGRDVGS